MSDAKHQPWWTYGAFRVQATTKREARVKLKALRRERVPKHANVRREAP